MVVVDSQTLAAMNGFNVPSLPVLVLRLSRQGVFPHGCLVQRLVPETVRSRDEVRFIQEGDESEPLSSGKS